MKRKGVGLRKGEKCLEGGAVRIEGFIPPSESRFWSSGESRV